MALVLGDKWPVQSESARPETRKVRRREMDTEVTNGVINAHKSRVSLPLLPYDLLFNVAQHLELYDIHALQLTCKALHDFVFTRPVFRSLAVALLKRCRALPLIGFQRLNDLTTEQLISAVTHATKLERAWLTRGPRPSSNSPYTDGPHEGADPKRWYKIISAPPGEEVDWLSPITSSYSLCATKSGKVVCWDVHRDECLAEWNPQERWELWKCRVEFEIKTVFFTMAKVLHKAYDDRLMEFVLMKLQFSDSEKDDTKPAPTPIFSRLASFRTIGVVMNVFLLDPSSRLLSAFVWVSTSNTIGLYALLDWNKPEYVFIDTGIECSMSSNWSCILYKEQIVIHSEESDVAFQYFYPLSLLASHTQRSSTSKRFIPRLSSRVGPTVTMSANFTFPAHLSSAANSTSGTDDTSTPTSAPNPFPFPPWYPESAHFVRQWWPTLPTVPRLSCTVVLLAEHNLHTHRTRYIIAQHYFQVPLVGRKAELSASVNGSPSQASSESGSEVEDGTRINGTDDLLKMWYVSQPFEVVCVMDGVDDDADGPADTERPRPLMAVDFGHAVWVELVEEPSTDPSQSIDTIGHKCLRFVSFPPVTPLLDSTCGDRVLAEKAKETEGTVHTLEIPKELDLDTVETINIDQSQGAVIISVRDGKIFILCYE